MRSTHKYIAIRFLKLSEHEDGTVTILTAVVMSLVLIAFACLAVDSMRGYLIQSRMSSALDAAGLAVGSKSLNPPANPPHNTTQQWANAQALRYFNANFPAGYMGASTITPAVTPNPDWGTVSLTANSKLPTFFNNKMLANTLPVGAASQVTTTGSTSNMLELVLVMDTSGAMAQSMPSGGTKLTAMQNGVDTLVEALFQGTAVSDNILVSLIPYSDGVKINATQANSWLSQPFIPLSDFDGCMTIRSGADTTSEISPNKSSDKFPRYVGPFNTSNIVITGYSVYNHTRSSAAPDVTLHYIWSPIVNGQITAEPTGGPMTTMAQIDGGTNSISNGVRLMITDPTLDLPGGRWISEIDYVTNEYDAGHHPTKAVNWSEMLRIDFGAEYLNAFSDVYISNLFYDPPSPTCATSPNSPLGCQEKGQWQAFNNNHVLVSGNSFLGLVPIVPTTYTTITAQAKQPFRTVEFTALDNGSGTGSWWYYDPITHPTESINSNTAIDDNSDYGVMGFDYQPHCSIAPSSFFLNDRGVIEAQVAGFTAAGPTHNDVGMAWGWYALSPDWAGFFNLGMPNLPAVYKGNTDKVAVILTQGTNLNTPTDDVTFSQICANMKADGINVFAIAFDVTTPNVKTILQGCASAANQYYDSPDATTLNAAFQNIANAIRLSNLRISK